MRRVGGEFMATVCIVGLLFLLTVISASILGAVVKPARAHEPSRAVRMSPGTKAATFPA